MRPSCSSRSAPWATPWRQPSRHRSRGSRAPPRSRPSPRRRARPARRPERKGCSRSTRATSASVSAANGWRKPAASAAAGRSCGNERGAHRLQRRRRRAPGAHPVRQCFEGELVAQLRVGRSEAVEQLEGERLPAAVVGDAPLARLQRLQRGRVEAGRRAGRAPTTRRRRRAATRPRPTSRGCRRVACRRRARDLNVSPIARSNVPRSGRVSRRQRIGEVHRPHRPGRSSIRLRLRHRRRPGDLSSSTSVRRAGRRRTLGFLVALRRSSLMSSRLIFMFTELTTAIPHAAARPDSRRAFGRPGVHRRLRDAGRVRVRAAGVTAARDRHRRQFPGSSRSVRSAPTSSFMAPTSPA